MVVPRVNRLRTTDLLIDEVEAMGTQNKKDHYRFTVIETVVVKEASREMAIILIAGTVKHDLHSWHRI